MTTDILTLSPALDAPEQLIAAWEAHNDSALQRYKRLAANLESESTVDLAMLSVLVNEMRTVESLRFEEQAME